MEVTLLHHTPLEIADHAIGKCWDKPTPDGEPCNIKRIHRVGNKNKHASTLEHLSYNFDIDGVSRALLQELARHRIASYSVKSSRYTLKELKDTKELVIEVDEDTYNLLDITSGDCGRCEITNKYYAIDIETVSNFLVIGGNPSVNIASALSLEKLRQLIVGNVSNDIAKYCMPEAYKTSITWTINARSLQNFLSLRTNKAALWEIRELAYEVFNKIPDDHKFLFEEFLYDNDEPNGAA